jgi:hypothetical protein
MVSSFFLLLTLQYSPSCMTLCKRGKSFPLRHPRCLTCSSGIRSLNALLCFRFVYISCIQDSYVVSVWEGPAGNVRGVAATARLRPLGIGSIHPECYSRTRFSRSSDNLPLQLQGLSSQNSALKWWKLNSTGLTFWSQIQRGALRKPSGKYWQLFGHIPTDPGISHS